MNFRDSYSKIDFLEMKSTNYEDFFTTFACEMPFLVTKMRD